MNPAEPTPIAVAAAVVIILGVAWALTWAILRAARYPAPTLMVTTLAILTLIALFGLGVADDTTAQEFGTLAAVGMGALAGAVTNHFGRHDDKEKHDDSNE
jgi:hypothetical protein